MASLNAKMRNIDHGSGIIRQKAYAAACGQRYHAFSQTQHGKGAQQPDCIDFQIHNHQICAMFQPVHKDVTKRPRDARKRMV